MPLDYFSKCCGDKSIDGITRADVNAFRDSLLNRGLAQSSCKRIISVLRAMLNFVCREYELNEISAFSGIHFQEDNFVIDKKRKPLPIPAIKEIQQECKIINDEPRWLISLISDTGLRLNEAIGIHVEDLNMDAEQPYVLIQPHPWRRLKTRSSQRKVPLVGASLWGAKEALNHAWNGALFPRYCNLTTTKSNSASAALNKWMKPRVPEGCVIHSFRHSIRDRLRAVMCPSEVADAIGGWSRDGIGESYGDGYDISLLTEWLDRAVRSNG